MMYIKISSYLCDTLLLAEQIKKSLAMAGYVDMKLDYSFKKAFSDKEQLCAFLNSRRTCREEGGTPESGMVAVQSETKKSID